MANDKEINILGAGISGLACAIILKRNGYNVNVYERAHTVGTRFNNDWQGIENWSEKQDVLKQIESYGVDVDFDYERLDQLNFHCDERKKLLPTKGGCYLVRRGSSEGCLEMALMKQAESAGVNFKFNHLPSSNEISYRVNATGPKNANILAKGIKFDTKAGDSFHMAFSKNIAPGFYSYLLVKNGHGTIATVFDKKSAPMAATYMKNTVDFFSDYLNVDDVSKGKSFGGFGYFEIKKSYSDDNGALLIGEAGGFQDYFWGFGMRYAFQSANLAAHSIMDDVSFDTLVKKTILTKMRHSKRNRYLFELFGAYSYPLIYNVLVKTNNPLKILNYVYR